ncbi:MAG: uroporphyrinogen-III C-methyltransferase [Pseudomonadota bacterium]
MSESRDKSEDETPAEAGAPEPTETPPDAPRTSSTEAPPAVPGKRGLLLALLYILVLALAGAGGYGGWWLYEAQRDTSERLAALEEQDDALGNRLEGRIDDLASARAEAAEQREALAEQLAAQAESLDAVTATTEAIEERLGRTGVDWTLAEVAHLLRTARYREHLADDGDGADAALAAADVRLATLDDPSLQPVREAIAAARQRLAARERPDTAGISARIGGLAATVEELPLHRPGTDGEPVSRAADATEHEGWRRHLDTILETLGELVVVRRHDQAVEALVPPEQDALLRLNLRLQLESAQAALVHGDAELFRNHVRRARDWIAHYFDDEADATRNALETLEAAAEARLTTPTVDLSGPLDALAEVTGGDAP